MSKIDIVVPCYNYGRYLGYCVESILAQHDVDLRVLIIDDCSTDNSSEIAEELARGDSRVEFRRNSVNLGHIKTFNIGVLDWATAPYTLLISADDALTPGALRRGLSVLDAHPEAGMVYGIARVIGGDDFPHDTNDPKTPTYQIISGLDFIRRNFEEGNPVPSPTALVRTELQQKTGGYCPLMLHTSDMEMWMRIAGIRSIIAIREAQAYYRRHDTNMTLQYATGVIRDLKERVRTCEYAVSTHARVAELDYESILAKMKRRFARTALYAAGDALIANDKQAFHAAVDFALEMDPSLKFSPAMLRTRLKQFLGGRSIKAVRAIAGRVTNRAPWTADIMTPIQNFGWWPG